MGKKKKSFLKQNSSGTTVVSLLRGHFPFLISFCTDNWLHVLMGTAFATPLLKQEIRDKATTLGLSLYLML